MSEQANISRVAFAAEYCSNGYNATEAYMFTHPRACRRSAQTLGTLTLKHPIVQGILDEARGRLMKKLEISEERILQEVACIALLDPRELFDEEGDPKKITELDEHVRRAVAGVDVKYGSDGRESTIIKLEAKTPAITLIMKYLKLLTDRVELDTTPVAAASAFDLAERVALLKSGEPAPPAAILTASVFG